MSPASRTRFCSLWTGITLAACGALTLVAAGDGVLPGDVAIARGVQDGDVPGAASLARFAYWVGGAPAIVGTAAPIAVLLWWGRRPGWALLVVGVVLLRGLNPYLKLVIESPRPTGDLVQVTELAPQYGFPSGHAMGVMLLFGSGIYLAERAVRPVWARRLVQVAAGLVILVTGFGRIYTGAHWPSDVLGGYLWGLTFLLILARWVR